MTESKAYYILKPEDHYTLTAQEFGMEGLIAVESVGPFVETQAVGPIITVHDSIIYAGKGIGHHPHRYNERLFYLEQGTFDHDDALNNIQGHIPEGGMARFTEGQRGMLHKEWNNGEVDAEIYILVATTDPVPAKTSFEVLEAKDMPVDTSESGVSVRYMVGGGALLPIYSDIRSFTDTKIAKDRSTEWVIPANEGGILSLRAGTIEIDSHRLEKKYTLISPPGDKSRKLRIQATKESRIIRTTFGKGLGLVRAGD